MGGGREGLTEQVVVSVADRLVPLALEEAEGPWLHLCLFSFTRQKLRTREQPLLQPVLAGRPHMGGVCRGQGLGVRVEGEDVAMETSALWWHWRQVRHQNTAFLDISSTIPHRNVHTAYIEMIF